MSPIVGFIGIVLLAVTLTLASRANRRRRRLAVIRTVDFPPGLDAAVRRQYPHLRAGQVQRVLDGLRQYLEVCARARLLYVAMPSRVVDVAWHEFILSTHAYAEFCRQAFGRFLHHTPTAAMAHAQPSTLGVARCWRIACAMEGIDPKRPSRLPLLFALDAELAIPDGFHYELDCGGRTTTGADGRPRHCATHLGCSGGCGGGSWLACAGACGSNGGDGGGGGDSGGCGGGCGGD